MNDLRTLLDQCSQEEIVGLATILQLKEASVDSIICGVGESPQRGG